MPDLDADVLIVGAGPTGLMLAGDLAAAGVAVTVLERRSTESNLTRAFAVNARTLELFDARGLADRLVPTGATVGELRLFGNVRIPLSDLPSRFPYLLVTPQYETERVLTDRLTDLGVTVTSGQEVVGLRQDATGVDVQVRRPDGSAGTSRASYVVGTDGIGSAVRRALDLPFPGRSAVRSVMLADVRLSDPPADVLTVNGVGEGFAFLAPFGDGYYRAIAWNRRNQLPDDAPVELDEIREITYAALGTDYGMHDARWMSRFHSDERQAPAYRVGRVFLAGDAAHVHSPALGLGMNTGLQGAANLSWKLAATVQGWARDGLLDTYQSERHPVGRLVLRASGTVLRLALLPAAPQRRLRNLIAGAAVRIAPIARRLIGVASGIGIRYPAPRGAHRLVGRRAPDMPLDAANGGPARLYEALRSGRYVLVTTDGKPTEPSEHMLQVAPADSTAGTILVRPDGYVAWASDFGAPTAQQGARRHVP